MTTGAMVDGGTRDHIMVTVVGTEGQSERTQLDEQDFSTGATRKFSVKSSVPLGRLLLVRVDKEPHLSFPEDPWYCHSVTVSTPEGATVLFPCYRWMESGERVELRAATAVKVFEEDHPVLIEHRQRELTEKKEFFQWRVYQERLPFACHFEKEEDLPTDLQLSENVKLDNQKRLNTTAIQLKKAGILGSKERWQSLDDIKKIFIFMKTARSEYVVEHWRDDDFFGSQFLNGVNPNVIRRCSELPLNFPVTEEMAQPFLEEGRSLESELQKGHMFLYDQRKFEGISPKTRDGTQLHVTPGLCLLHLDSQQTLKPIAIQLYQQPSDENPIFLPSDSETDWILAKMFLKNVDILDHEAVQHLLLTHLLEEVYFISMLRNLPLVHPIYKLLIPHFRFTLHLNVRARLVLMGPTGTFSHCSLGREGVVELMRRSLSELSYSALCLPDNINARGLESVPNFYYREDGLQLWDIINSFVRAVLEHFYPSDGDVSRDSELQDWVSEIFTRGLLGNTASGFPQSFGSVQDLVKFLTMVIFTASGQHAAVNLGQFDYLSWVPNASLLLTTAPPRTKGQTDMQSVLDALPNVGETALFTAMFWQLANQIAEPVFLGSYPEQHFCDPELELMIKEFQSKLSSLNDVITERNSGLTVPYTYLLPTILENSITA